jgi:hypothetical protein
MKSSVATGLLLAMLFTGACSEPQQPAAETKAEQKEEKKAYLPVSDYLQSEIRKVDSSVTGILMRKSETHINYDSVFITNQQFHALAQDFFAPELARESFERSFKETSFFDETTESFTFTYEATDSAVSVRRVDVLIAPSMELDKIKTIYIEKKYASGDTAITKKMIWNAGSDFSIVTIKAVQKTPDRHWSNVHQAKVIWDPLKY